MIVRSTRFGELEVTEEQIFDFPQGIPGFPDEKRFVFLDYQPDSPFYFLQSVAEPNLTFLLIDPFSFFTDYQFALDDDVAAEIGLSRDNPPAVYNIATVKGSLENMTANLVAPVLINARDCKGKQIVLEKSEYTTRYRLFPDGLSSKKTVEGGR